MYAIDKSLAIKRPNKVNGNLEKKVKKWRKSYYMACAGWIILVMI